jgi:hypothetical protein
LIFLTGLICGSFQFAPVFYSSSFFIRHFFHFLRSSTLLITFCVIHDFSCFLVDLPTKSLTVYSTHFLTMFRFTSTFPFSHSIAPSFSSRLSCTFCHSACNFSKYHLGFTFWNIMILFSIVQTFATSKLCSESVCSRQWLHILHTVSESMFHKYTVHKMSLSISWCLPGVLN